MTCAPHSPRPHGLHSGEVLPEGAQLIRHVRGLPALLPCAPGSRRQRSLRPRRSARSTFASWPGERHPGLPAPSAPKARVELGALLPGWRDAARAIGWLGVGPVDAEYVGGVLWTGLTDKKPSRTRRSKNASSPTGSPARRPRTAGTGPRSARSWTNTCPTGSGPRPRSRDRGAASAPSRSGYAATGGIRDGRWSARRPRQPDRTIGGGWPRRTAPPPP